MPTPIDGRPPLRRARLVAGLLAALAGCGEPSARELKNRQEFEALLTAIALKNPRELERDATRVDRRHAAGQLSDDAYQQLRALIATARAGDWGAAEKRAYEFREAHPYFR